MLNKYFFQFVLLFNYRKKIFLTTICISSLYKILQEMCEKKNKNTCVI